MDVARNRAIAVHDQVDRNERVLVNVNNLVGASGKSTKKDLLTVLSLTCR